MIEVEIHKTETFEGEIPREVHLLAERLSRIHGEILITRESSGIHLYMASPKCLDQDGDRELVKKHLAVNAEKFLRLGRYRNLARTRKAAMSAYCMKTSTPYSVDHLLGMPPLEMRGIKVSKTGVRTNANTACLIDDGAGNKIPDYPGNTVGLSQLPQGHPALEYLESRGFNPDHLERQFRCVYCYAEAPEDRTMRRFYRRLPGGFRDTPQGRLIFFVDMNGVQVGWQARVLDKWEGLYHYYWHPYDEKWVAVEYRDPVTNKKQLLPAFKDEEREWDISKYSTARGAARNQLLMGYDAALAWNQGRPKKYAILVEGPLDAGRLGSPAVAMLGKFLSDAQAAKLEQAFDHVIIVADNDVVGREYAQKAYKKLSKRVSCSLERLPTLDEGQDPGDLHPTLVDYFRKKWIS